MPRKPDQSDLAAYLGFAQARALLLGSYAAKAASISACSRGADRAARLAALAAEQQAALKALLREWRARQERTPSTAFPSAKAGVTLKRLNPSRRKRDLRPSARRATYHVNLNP
jgi:hypothetical protein